MTTAPPSEPETTAGEPSTATPEAPAKLSRRRLLAGGAVAGLGAALAVGGDAIVRSRSASGDEEAGPIGKQTVAFYGPHQAGIDMSPQANQTLVAVDLHDDIAKADLKRLFTIISEDAARMTQGTYALADSEPEFAATPARLTVTFGVGPKVVELSRGKKDVPTWLGPLPAFEVDALRDEWNDGDLVLQIASEDPTTLAHTTRMLLKDLRTFGSVRWQQTGFRTAHGTQPSGTTMRNMLGQLDGTVNPKPGTEDFNGIVWRDGSEHPWLDGGTSMVVRRIEMLLDKWDRLDRSGREGSVGRRLDNGAPLTGSKEADEPDFDAKTPVGFPVIAEFAHIRRARTGDQAERIFRRGYNYDLGGADDLVSNSGLVFTSFQADPDRQFVPIQQRLSDLDLLNEWISPIGSAVFAILPGAQQGGFVGETLF